mmetsp:Transcript_30892/g.68407  ORF Transcript_30892/g.68407 Transcript_30892/m.68407 type:complete len:127 (+) Transcript_30892:1237-1617(+)
MHSAQPDWVPSQHPATCMSYASGHAQARHTVTTCNTGARTLQTTGLLPYPDEDCCSLQRTAVLLLYPCHSQLQHSRGLTGTGRGRMRPSRAGATHRCAQGQASRPGSGGQLAAGPLTRVILRALTS